MHLPPGRRTSISGRSRPSSDVTVVWVSKSQWSSMPAISTTRRNWISPQCPRTLGVRSAVTSFPVSERSWDCVSIRSEIAVVQHAGHLPPPPQLDLSPMPAHTGRTQRRHQLPGFRAKLGLRFDQAPYLLAERGVSSHAGLLQFLDLTRHAVQRGADRRHQLSDGLLT